MLLNEIHLQKALSPIFVTDDGIVIRDNDEHSQNSLFSIFLTEEGRDICVNFEHCLKAFGPISIPGWDNKSWTISMWFFSAAKCNAVTLKKKDD